jgi:hypothetical protein
MQAKFKEFLAELSKPKTLIKINNESNPPAGRTRRLDSDIMWGALEGTFGLDGDGGLAELKAKQECSSDVSCLQLETIKHLKLLLDEEMLQQLQSIVTACHHPPYSSLAGWFPPVNKEARRQWGDESPKTLMVAKWMRPPAKQKMISQKQSTLNLGRRHKHPLSVVYEATRRIVQRWGVPRGNPLEVFLAVQAAIGPRQTALLDPKIKFVAAQEHDKRFWIKQRGVLKDKTQEFDEKTGDLISGKTPEKPIIFGFTFKQIDEMIKYIRKHLPVNGLTRAEMGRKYNRELNKIIKGAFPGAAKHYPRLGTHFTRKLYVNIAYHFFGPEIGSTINDFASIVLGHNTNSIETSLSYTAIQVQYGIPENVSASTKETAIDNRVAIAQMQEELGELKKRQLWESKEEEDEGSDMEEADVNARIRHRQRLKREFIDITNRKQKKIRVQFNGKRKRDGSGLVMAKLAVKQLKLADVSPTNLRVRSLGFGGENTRLALVSPLAAVTEKVGRSQ